MCNLSARSPHIENGAPLHCGSSPDCPFVLGGRDYRHTSETMGSAFSHRRYGSKYAWKNLALPSDLNPGLYDVSDVCDSGTLSREYHSQLCVLNAFVLV